MNKFLVKLTVFSYCIGGNRLDFTSHEISKFQKRFSIWNFRFSRFLCSISGTRSSLEFARKISSWNCNPDPCPKLIQFMMRVDVLSNPQNNKKIKFDDVNRIFGHFEWPPGGLLGACQHICQVWCYYVVLLYYVMVNQLLWA